MGWESELMFCEKCSPTHVHICLSFIFHKDIAITLESQTSFYINQEICSELFQPNLWNSEFVTIINSDLGLGITNQNTALVSLVNAIFMAMGDGQWLIQWNFDVYSAFNINFY